MSFVLDNSITMCWLLKDGKPNDVDYAFQVLHACAETTAFVPCIWYLEVANVIAKMELKNIVPKVRSQEFLVTLQRMDIVADPSMQFVFRETLDLARRYKLSAYDAAYLELSIRQGLPLATLDEALKKSAEKAGVKLFIPEFD